MHHPDTQKAAFDDVTLAYRILNRGHAATPLLMIQGLTAVKEDWAGLAEALALDRPVLVYDNRGMGESSVPDGPYSVEQLARDGLRMLDHVGWPAAHVMGISMGGMIAQELVLIAPERAGKLVLGCTGHGGAQAHWPGQEVLASFMIQPGEQPRDVTARLMRINLTEAWIAANPNEFERIVDDSLGRRRSKRGMIGQMGAVMNFDVAERISGIEHETLIIHGREDRLLPYPNAELMAAKIPRSKLLDLPNAGHMFWRMDEGESARAIREFLIGV